jgi:hypothetical protein
MSTSFKGKESDLRSEHFHVVLPAKDGHEIEGPTLRGFENRSVLEKIATALGGRIKED